MEMVLFQFGSAFPTIIQNMQNMGFFLYLFPFLLALAFIYGIMFKTLGNSLPKSAIGLVSIILSFFVMLFASWNPSIVMFLASLSGMGLLVLSGLLFIIILFGLVGFDYKSLFDFSAHKHSAWLWIFLIIFIGILIFFGAGAGNFISMPGWSMTSEFWTALFFIVIVAVVIFWFGNEGSGGEKPSPKT